MYYIVQAGSIANPKDIFVIPSEQFLGFDEACDLADMHKESNGDCTFHVVDHASGRVVYSRF